MTHPMPSRERITFLVWTLDGVGGVARTVINLANELVDHHEVSIISTLRMREEITFPLDPRIKVTWLLDSRPLADGRLRRPRRVGSRFSWRGFLDRRPSRMAGETEAMGSLLVEKLLKRAIRGLTEPGVLITTRPILHGAAARWAGPHLLTVAQEHLNFITRSRNTTVHRLIEESVVHLDAFVVLTEADRVDYASRLGGRTRIEAIPNSLPWSIDGQVSTLDSKVVVAAGRFEPRKGFLRLIDAYAPLAAEFPDWQLHIYGQGDFEPDIRSKIEEWGVGDQVVLRGYSDDFRSVLRSSAVCAMAPHYEGFLLVIIEAMSQGVPSVVMDCPRGPGELVVDGVTGYLVPDGDVAGFTAALRNIMKDDALRQRMGEEAFRLAHQYEVSAVAERWDQLIDELIEKRSLA